MGKRIAALVVGGLASLVLAAGCSVAGQPQAAPAATSPETVTTTETSTVTATRQQPTTVTETVVATTPQFVPPAGFEDWGEGLAARWTDQSAFDCAATADSCWGVELFSQDGCTNGILIVLDVFRADAKVSVLDSTTAAVGPGATVSVVLDQSGLGTGLTAKMADIRCVFG